MVPNEHTIATSGVPSRTRSGWVWIPPLYFAEGIPYVVTMSVSVIMYKRLGVSNVEIALYTSWLYLPWVVKPLWSPFVDLYGTKRMWIVAMQLLVAVGFAGVAWAIPAVAMLRATLIFLWILAFASATHDIAADGFYILGLNQRDQAWFVGVRSTFYRLAMIVGQGPLVMLAGRLETELGNAVQGWMITFWAIAAYFLFSSLYHMGVLPRAESGSTEGCPHHTEPLGDVVATFAEFLRKPRIVSAIAFLLLFRFAEAQLVKLAAPFLVDTRQAGGLALTTEQVGIVYGTVGVGMLTIGGLAGGFLAARHGMKRWLWWMVMAMNLPNAVYVYLAFAQPYDSVVINVAVGIEQFGYGFGFTAYMLYMIRISEGEHETASFALCTAFMALGMMGPGMVSGYLQSLLGYPLFFVWILVATLPSFVAAYLISGDPRLR